MKTRRYQKHRTSLNNITTRYDEIPASREEQWQGAREEGKREAIKEQKRLCKIKVILTAAVAVAIILLVVWKS